MFTKRQHGWNPLRSRESPRRRILKFRACARRPSFRRISTYARRVVTVYHRYWVAAAKEISTRFYFWIKWHSLSFERLRNFGQICGWLFYKNREWLVYPVGGRRSIEAVATRALHRCACTFKYTAWRYTIDRCGGRRTRVNFNFRAIYCPVLLRETVVSVGSYRTLAVDFLGIVASASQTTSSAKVN